MKISMAGVDYKTAPLALRERIAFSENRVRELTKRITEEDGIAGCVLVSTCNRTEIYVSAAGEVHAAGLLFRHCGADAQVFGGYVRERYGRDAVRYLAEVACGLHSAILCEEQIVAQLGDAAELSRLAGCTDPVLNTLFRCAVTAGKRALTDFSVRNVPLSSAQAAADRAEALYGSLRGRRALIIGNGKMGLLAAEALLQKGCGVCITLRRYKHGDNIVPDGAATVDFADRMRVYAQSDFVITATRSPHCTIYLDAVKQCGRQPDYIFDLAVPRDVEQGVEQYVRVFDIDSLCSGGTVDKETIAGIQAVAERYADEFIRWEGCRRSLSK